MASERINKLMRDKKMKMINKLRTRRANKELKSATKSAAVNKLKPTKGTEVKKSEGTKTAPDSGKTKATKSSVQTKSPAISKTYKSEIYMNDWDPSKGHKENIDATIKKKFSTKKGEKIMKKLKSKGK